MYNTKTYRFIYALSYIGYLAFVGGVILELTIVLAFGEIGYNLAAQVFGTIIIFLVGFVLIILWYFLNS